MREGGREAEEGGGRREKAEEEEGRGKQAGEEVVAKGWALFPAALWCGPH